MASPLQNDTSVAVRCFCPCAAVPRLGSAVMLCLAVELVGAILTSGCSTRSQGAIVKTPLAAPQPIAAATAADVSQSAANTLIGQADASFAQHSWQDAIMNYQAALHIGLPHASVATHGSDSYARHRISLAAMYDGLTEKDDLDLAEQDYRLSVQSDSTNKAAKKLLARILTADNATLRL